MPKTPTVKKKKKKKQIKHLWETVFDDSNEFTQLYFKKVYKDENALVIEKNGQVASALQMLSYSMTFYGTEISVAYISGACTLPSEQGKGLMGQLLQKAFEEMKRKKIALSVLIPAQKDLFNYYRAHGYTEIFEYSLKIYTRSEHIEPDQDGLFVLQAKKPDETIYTYFEGKSRGRPVSIQHSYDDFAVILKDLRISNGELFVTFDSDNQLVGMAFVSSPEIKTKPEESSILIKEILYDNEHVKNRMLYEITKRHNLVKAVYRIPFNNSAVTYPYGMARVIDTELLINLWASTHPESSLTVNDMKAMNIYALTRHLLGYSDRIAYMSLMLD
jgi:predicted GNAT family N-acyltransferase